MFEDPFERMKDKLDVLSEQEQVVNCIEDDGPFEEVSGQRDGGTMEEEGNAKKMFIANCQAV